MHTVCHYCEPALVLFDFVDLKLPFNVPLKIGKLLSPSEELCTCCITCTVTCNSMVVKDI